MINVILIMCYADLPVAHFENSSNARIESPQSVEPNCSHGSLSAIPSDASNYPIVQCNLPFNGNQDPRHLVLA